MLAASLLALAGQSAALAQEPDEHTLKMRSGDVDTSVARVDLTQIARERRADAKVVIQLDGPMTEERQQALRDAGVKLGEYLPPNAYVVRMDRADPAKVAALPFIRWQDTFQPEWKLDPEIGLRPYTTPERQDESRAGRASVVVHVFEGDDANAVADAIRAIPGADVQLIDVHPGATTITASMKWNDTVLLSDIAGVKFVEDAPENELRSNANTRWIVQSNIPGITPLYDNGLRGEGQIVAVQDSALDRNHCSFLDPVNPVGDNHRKILRYNTAAGSVSHGTHVAGIVAGDAGDNTDTRGVAYLAKIVYDTYGPQDESTITARLLNHYNQGARVHTNSWGDDGTTAYTGQCRGIDNHVWNFEDSLVLFAVTNTTALKTPENAKNCLAVGATGGLGGQDSFCSGGTGPTIDGRRKPEIFAPGCASNSAANSTGCGLRALTGTSMACPAVAGVAVLARQYFTSGYYPTGTPVPSNAFNPSAALLKAVIINSGADMTGIAGYPSNQEGWGRVVADDALYFPGDARNLWVFDLRNAQGMSTGQRTDHGFVVGAGQPLEITLSFTDAPAAVNATFAAVNDLDLEVFGPGGVLYRGNNVVLGASQVGGSKDAVNNVEVVRIPVPAAGNYLVRVRAAAVNVGTQGYALAVTGDVEEGIRPISLVAVNPPALLTPGQPTQVTAEIVPGDEAIVPGSAVLAYRYDAGPFQTVPLVPAGGESYVASLPPAPCSAAPQFYVSVQGNTSGTVSSPSSGASSPLTALVGAFATAFFDDASTNQNWTFGLPTDTAISGVWTRVDPVGTSSQPEDDITPDANGFCFVTGQHTSGQGAGFNDVDGGFTTLLSPTLNLAGLSTGTTISYWRWFAGGPEDSLVVSLSNDNGSTWAVVDTVSGGSGGWQQFSFQPANFRPLTAQMRVRFVAGDFGTGTLVEAAVDDVLVRSFDCVAPAFCTGDANNDGVVNFGDITNVLANFGTRNVAGDADNNGDVNFADITAVLANFGSTCD